nr:acyltransferase family protein [Pseudodesulfovibrio sp. zrk46]
MVVILHAACAYAIIIPWWPAQEFPKPLFYTFLIMFFDIFCMPTLFFIAGYFSPSSIKRHGTKRFVFRKLKRLGIPFIMLGLFFVPYLSYLGYFGRTESPKGFFSMWWYQLKNAMTPEVVLFDSPEIGIAHINDYSVWHLWFLTLLLMFFILYAVIVKISPKLLQGKMPDQSSRSIMTAMLVAGVIAMLTVTGINLIIPVWSWLKCSGIFMVQPSRIGLYLTLFFLGTWASTQNWFSSGKFPLPFGVWLTMGILSFAMLIFISKGIMENTGPAPLGLAVATGAVRSVAALSWLGTLIKGTQLWWNSQGRVSRSLSRSSYDIYLLHMLFVIGVQFLAIGLPVPYFFKFLIAAVSGVLISWWLSRQLVSPYPKTAIGLLVGAWGLACVVI